MALKLVTDFGVFDTHQNLPSDTNQGLVKLSFFQKILVRFQMWAFNRKIKAGEQPSFFINKESWRSLVLGKNIPEITEISQNYEIYGFVFCAAFSAEFQRRGYFRIRTIFKEIGEQNDSKIKVYVETNHVAIANLGWNNPNSNDDLKFIDDSWSMKEL